MYSTLFPMVTHQVTCRHCGSIEITRHGLTANGKQRFLCHGCWRYSRENPQPNGYTEQARETILRAYEERSSLRGLSRTFGVSRNTVTSRLNKSGEAAGVDRDARRTRRRKA